MSPLIPLPIGSSAPVFILPDDRGSFVSLCDLVGRGCVLLIFYPADWGMICRNEIVAFRDMQADFERAGVQLVASSYNDVVSHGLWSDTLKLRFPLLVDRDMSMAKAYGVYDDKPESFNRGRSERALFIIDRSQTIVWSWVAESSWLEPDYDEVLSAAQRFAHEEPAGAIIPAELPADL